MRLVCCGLATLDVVQVVDAVPGSNAKVVARSLSVTFGGPAANAAAAAVALGVPARLVTALGRSPLSTLVRSGLEAAGVEVVDLLDGPGSPAVSTVLVTASTGERAVVSVNATGVSGLGPAAPWVADATAVLVDGHHLGAAVELASAASVPVLLDGGSWKPGLGSLLRFVDHAVLSADFRLPEPVADLAAAVAALGPSSVAISAGAGAIRLVTGGVESWIEVPVVDDVVDTLGAGDVLHGAIGAALARGEDIATALAAGALVASESVRHQGALGWATARA
ncbi:PfkB family carbohydrate kinase [Cellulomonas sp. PhB150]|uniref:PfkB family carbohydrate kinase n=1 Tax=Cellulomonas sp. PhB150 TaxID=2485188 RepID=UPI000F49AEA8|nr:PfkB family carbohydrate kinase [Cellulomonas sp. PhB150]ROS27947.1 sugar/nucleoside kinase (ribokinase family) [Cellulomonas sp. PhB150]